MATQNTITPVYEVGNLHAISFVKNGRNTNPSIPKQELTAQERITYAKPTVINIIIQFLEEYEGQVFGTHNIEDVRRFGEKKYNVSHNIGTYDRKWRELRSMYPDPLDFRIERIGKRFVYDSNYANSRRENIFKVIKISEDYQTNLFKDMA